MTTTTPTLAKSSQNSAVLSQTPSQRQERDSSQTYEQRREESLRATGEILRQRCVAKMERMNQLKEELAKKQSKKRPEPKGDPATAILQMEEARLRADIQSVQSNLDEQQPEVLPELTKIRVHRMVQDSIQDYALMTPLLKKELEDTKKELVAEKTLLKELKVITDAIQTRRSDLEKAVESGTSQESSQGRQKMLEIKKQVQDLMRELTGFLSEHYPPYQPDPDSEDVFELKHILEDIMNNAVSKPADPYVVLVPGEYYPPHVERLINAGIAVRHPRDAQKLRLIDFHS
ncbi:hypothetical protein BGZ83_005627 [Gryganskiella cystojenkinii]|nr:hypothetical protein BGZ83_005627 [Gryganskiella cystojenkinii]